ncbi:MAG: type II secretion system protein GspH [Candidatus Dactylopiibacterium carminicum]|uniref:Type II secretion system protein H n=1 Tax=Candidatus Dactylopiibacterium carminicum TaxID=857335 RepID=A0A272ENK5_9RHOO|nr:GspH/FimT family pseudopilin [Candidatus Dactylopiibacterium carminicum]KAF7599152.1 type II secretion system protein GspH [Candidatus Dactylopiibacterium carminicum]PAS91695.1 MAG: type II secretion system protein GspH [Candidatus Dactylopiibacterium carminicum]PAS93761.1 MAG: type II secretion system protein GspH [Candidatus Dactylopiibacterium carminicum]PAS99139.1 MAG: type II secretion system protein GspH [Candidatus Dactylopiibacterium carminicum]
MLRRSYIAGFTLIELMIVLAIMAILTMLTIPSLATWMANSRVRSVAEAMQNAIRQAQAEALTRNRQVVFALTNTTPALNAAASANGKHWYMQVLPLVDAGENASTFIRGEKVASTNSVTITGNAVTCFNSQGRLASNTSTGLGNDCTLPGNLVSFGLTATGADRPLRVEVYLGGKVRLCDPAKTLSSTQPEGCSA